MRSDSPWTIIEHVQQGDADGGGFAAPLIAEALGLP